MTATRTAALGDVATIVRHTVDPDQIRDGTMYVGLENIQPGGSFSGVSTVKAGELASSKFLFDANHILFGKLRPNLAKIARPDFSGVCSTDILPIEPGPSLDRSYVAHFLAQPAVVALATQRASGANLPRLNPNDLKRFRLPLPPLDEQRRIAQILDFANALRWKRLVATQILDRLADSTYHHHFETEENEIGTKGIGATLGEVSDIVGGITKGRRTRDTNLQVVPYLAVSNVQDGSLDLKVVKTIAASPREIERYRLLPGDLLLTEGGDPDKLGRGTIWRGELEGALHQNHVFRVRLLGRNLLPEFVRAQLSTPRARRYFLRSAKQTTGIASINKTQLSALPLFLPSIEAQSAFVAQLARHSTLRNHNAAHLIHLDELFASLRSFAFAGEL